MRTELSGLSILIVDDEPETRAMLSAYLGACGATTYCAASVADAIDVAGRVELDLIVTDIAMPGGDGYALLENVLEHHPSTPVISLSGYASAEEARRSAAAGFRLHISKPVRPRALVVSISELVAVAQ
ncbi:MAG TPA: response regulator [Kofleriaceae bacterium]